MYVLKLITLGTYTLISDKIHQSNKHYSSIVYILVLGWQKIK